MRKALIPIVILAILIIGAGLFFLRPWESKAIRIGFNLPLSGSLKTVGEASTRTAAMVKETIDAEGGLKVGDKRYDVEFIFRDNQTEVEGATNAAVALIVREEVHGIIGPQSSSQAIPAGEICDINSTPMISPWSTNPQTTSFRPYVFRGCFLDPFQGPVAAKFVTKKFDAKTAAVIYDKESDYPRGLAEYFKDAFEKIHGIDSVVAYEAFATKDTDFSAQLTKIVESGADVLFVPQYAHEIHLIVKQAHKLGWTRPIMGSDSWGSTELMKLCGDDCNGLFFSSHYAAAGAKGATKTFIDQFKKKYGHTPDDVAALTWDSTRLLLSAIRNTRGLSGDLMTDRDAIKDQLATITDFDGITGNMSFTPEGDPSKCAVVVRISDNGAFEFFESVCP